MNDILTAEPMAPTRPSASVSARNPRNRCAHCGRPFGLVRQRLATKQLCSKPCVEAESERMQRALKDKVRRLAGRA